MSRFTLYGLKTCDTCRKAITALEAAGHKVTVIEIRDEAAVTARLIARWADEAGWEALLNTRSTTWRQLTPAQKKDVDEDKALKLMSAHRALIKRPVIEWGEEVFVGWGQEVQDALI